MWLFRRSRNSPADVEKLEQNVTRLRSTLATCKGIAQRRELWLVAAVTAVIMLLGFVIVINRGPIEQVISNWIPAFSAPQPIQPVDAAYAAHQKGDYAAALRLVRAPAEQGDARAQSLLGLIYSSGHVAPRDDREATKWFRSAADQGDAVAQLQMGVMYSEGRSVPQDYSEAARWYQLAADRGNPEAQFNLGILYATGKGIPQDNVLAHMWFNLAAARFTAPIPRERAVGNRDAVELKMSPEEIAEAQELALKRKPK
jgi:Sel1 repeat